MKQVFWKAIKFHLLVALAQWQSDFVLGMISVSLVSSLIAESVQWPPAALKKSALGFLHQGLSSNDVSGSQAIGLIRKHISGSFGANEDPRNGVK